MMKHVLVAAGAVSLLAACADNYDLEPTRAMTAQGDAFTAALHTAYLERAAFERAEGDWTDTKYFNIRAKSAAAGTAPAVPELSARGVSGTDLSAARATLVERLGTTAPSDTPEACAQSQAWFEHWMEQVEEGHQPDHIEMAQGKFNEWIAQCEPAIVDPQDFVILFPLDSATLSDPARDEIARAAAFYKEVGTASVTLVGHTDTSGSAAYNQALSERRASMVTSALTAQGVPAEAINRSAKGETMTAVATGDGVEELQNRRVTITVAPAAGS